VKLFLKASMATLDIVKTYLNSNFKGINDVTKIMTDISADKQKHYIMYECAAAIKYDMYLWTHLPNEVLDNIGAIRNTQKGTPRDMGIDCASADLSSVLQAKYYSDGTRISWRTISTFYMYSDALNIGQTGRLVVHPTDAIVDSALSVANKIKFEVLDESYIELIIRQSLNLPEEQVIGSIDIIDNIEDAVPIKYEDEESQTNVDDSETQTNADASETQTNVDDDSDTQSLADDSELQTPINNELRISDIIGNIDQPINGQQKEDNIGRPFIGQKEDNIGRPINGQPINGQPKEDNIGQKENISHHHQEEIIVEKNKEIILRPYQVECINELITNLYAANDEDDEPIIARMQLACGLGKSIIIAAAINHIYNQPQMRKKYLILVPSRALLYQMRADFKLVAPKLDVGIVGDGHKQINKDIIICIYNSMAHVMNIEFEITIVDEAHHLDSENIWREQMDQINCMRFGFFSATLYNDSIEPDFDRNIDFGVENGYLCDYALMIPVFRPETVEDSFKRQLAELITIHYEWTHILAYCNTLESARQFNDILNAVGISSIYFDGTTPIDQRNNLVKDFVNGKYRVLTTVAVLAEGINLPIANTCMFVEPRNSAVNVAQCIGRISRLHETKRMSYVVLPSVNEESDLRRFLQLMSGYDRRLNKNIGRSTGRINVIYDLIPVEEKEMELMHIKVYENIRSMIENFSNWNLIYNALVEYVNTNGKLPTRQTNKTLGWWCEKQRKKYKTNKLSADKITKLNSIKYWFWEYDLDSAWQEKYNQLLQYVLINKRIPPRSTGNLGNWCDSQRQIYKKCKLTPIRINALQSINIWFWKKEKDLSSWQDKYIQLLRYIMTNGKLPKSNKDFGPWCSRQKDNYKNNKLSADKIAKLNEIPIWKWSFK
jgi:superfamily II DNA or RNA helicase